MTFKAFCIGGKSLKDKEYHYGREVDLGTRNYDFMPDGPLVFGNINMTIDQAPFEQKLDGTMTKGRSSDAPWRSTMAKAPKEEGRMEARD